MWFTARISLAGVIHATVRSGSSSAAESCRSAPQPAQKGTMFEFSRPQAVQGMRICSSRSGCPAREGRVASISGTLESVSSSGAAASSEMSPGSGERALCAARSAASCQAVSPPVP